MEKSLCGKYIKEYGGGGGGLFANFSSMYTPGGNTGRGFMQH